jgi:hypothetical protein
MPRLDILESDGRNFPSSVRDLEMDLVNVNHE